ncbi:TRAP transporter large permease [Rubrobacter taiwanensis]|jgi:tripartite ATP-independent transporter DctM subunit|uniref:TRAP transporter large permease n=1 Tax=Rubrobacter taiwanensis TaxID=185139 RepID=A0A4R1B7T2_9ACTN|nr:TRAP transporter large permease [Rubrobacter taiwanensis]TCJ12708.1 TRAP transporter large permease [Rubrobacter taiwanensis]
MPPEWVGILAFVAILILLALRVPVGLAMIAVSAIGTAFITGLDVALVRLGSDAFGGANSYSLSVIPLFILMGLFLAGAQLADDLYTGLQAFLGRIKGGLAGATIGASALFGAVSGSATASASTMSTVAVPQMRQRGYSDSLATGCAAVGGTLGILIPPSAILVFYGILTEEPIGRVLIAGVIPGIMTTCLLILTAYLLVRFRPHLGPAQHVEQSSVSRLQAIGRIWPVPVIFGLSIGGIYGGVFTPTEAGAVGAFLSLLFGIVTRRLNWQRFWEALEKSVRLTAMIFLIAIGGLMFGYFLTITRIPRNISIFVADLNIHPALVIAVIFLIYFALGTLMDELAILVIMTPIIYPVVIQLGYDGVWFGVLSVMMLLVGLLTPPVGLLCFVVSGITKVPLGTVYRGVTPFWITLIVAIALVVAFPSIVTFLPDRM